MDSLTYSKEATRLEEILLRNDAKEISSFIKRHGSDIENIRAVHFLATLYAKEQNNTKLKLLLDNIEHDCSYFAVRAIRADDFKQFSFFIPYCTDLNDLIMWAISFKHTNMVIALLEAGVDLDIRHHAPANYLVAHTSLALVKKYLDPLSDEHVQAHYPDSLVLFSESESTEIEVAQYLISRGIDIKLAEGLAIKKAFNAKNLPLIKLLIPYYKVDELSHIEILKLRSAIKAHSTPYQLLMSLDEKEHLLLNEALRLYFLSTTRSPFDYLKSCPIWQKTSVLAFSQETI